MITAQVFAELSKLLWNLLTFHFTFTFAQMPRHVSTINLNASKHLKEIDLLLLK